MGLAQASGKVLALNWSDATPQSISASEQSALAPTTIIVPLTVTVKHSWGALGSQSENLTTKLAITLTTVPASPQSVTGTLQVPGDYGRYLVGDILGGIAWVTNAVDNNLITPLETAVLTPLLSAVTSALNSLLGVTIAGSTYTPLPTPGCGTPKLNN
ncbi:hypothetical protein [Nocardioides sp. Iso805N]|uniref:hypothetical protein n=1 Tax=Nocardioides sp. Iso805N TaxID=1283287 RepID=UPI00037E7798|nr:hypothetical protein [Nocardioides sp. Iso805N]